jgi:guanylate kinase
MSIVYIISAPSGSGKSTLVEKLLKKVPGLDFSISYTTRPPRGSEQNGREYCFVSREEFDQMVRRNQLLEHAEVFGHCYGTAKRFLQEAEQKGHDLLLDIDVQGAAQIKQKLPDAVRVFVLPPDRETLERRLRNRGSDSESVIRRRLVTASREIENYDKYDYILINDRLDQSIDELIAVVLSERLRSAGTKPSSNDQKMMEIAERCRLDKVRERVQPILASFVTHAAQGGR